MVTESTAVGTWAGVHVAGADQAPDPALWMKAASAVLPHDTVNATQNAKVNNHRDPPSAADDFLLIRIGKSKKVRLGVIVVLVHLSESVVGIVPSQGGG